MSVQVVEAMAVRKPFAVTSGHWGCCPRCYNLVHDREADGSLIWRCVWCGTPLDWSAAIKEAEQK